MSSTGEQIIQQLFSIMQQVVSQTQFMSDIRRSMSKACAVLVGNFNSALTNLVLIRRDAYPNLDAFRLCNLCSAPVSGGDLFDRSLMQEYEQHLIGLRVKEVSKKERFHPYKKKKGKGGNQYQHISQDMFYQPVLTTPIYSATAPFLSPLRGGGGGGGCVCGHRECGCCRGHSHEGNTPSAKL